MPLYDSHIQKSRRTYSGEGYSTARIIQWLNECEDNEAQLQVRELIKAGVTLARATPKQSKGSTLSVEIRKVLSLERRINKWIAKYKAMPKLALVTKGKRRDFDWHFYWDPIDRGSWSRRIGKLHFRVSEFEAVTGLLDLGLRNMARIQFCECSRAYYQRFSHQKFCSEKCRLQHYAKADDWKAYRREKARQYYQLHTRKNVK